MATYALRQFLKGRGANLRGGYKRRKEEVLGRIQKLNERLENPSSLNIKGELLKERYALEAQLEHILEVEELYCQQRGGEKWTLKGDSNTSFFHLSANGRRRKKHIFFLDHVGQTLIDQKEIALLLNHQNHKTMA